MPRRLTAGYAADTPTRRLLTLVVGSVVALVVATAADASGLIGLLTGDRLAERAETGDQTDEWSRRADGDGSALAANQGSRMTGSTTSSTTTTEAPATSPPMTIEPVPAVTDLAPVITRVPTDDPVVFLTIDDGLTRHPEGLEEFRRLGIPASLFLVDGPVQQDPDYFGAMPRTLVEAHSKTHANMVDLSEAEQQAEICGNADVIEQAYGRRPLLFRPPFGNYNEATQRAAAACGMRAVVLWQENVNWDVIGYREVQELRSGDIILMHFRPQFVEELHTVKNAVDAAGLRFALLEDYLEVW
jgi:peptidoglycan/xylan/chitin deacetylase (PgdA/CDA1 family)